MYLLHGNNDTASGWTDVGKANFIGSGDRPDMPGDVIAQLALQLWMWLNATLQSHERDDALSFQFIRPSYDCRFSDVLMTHQRTFYLRCA